MFRLLQKGNLMTLRAANSQQRPVDRWLVIGLPSASTLWRGYKSNVILYWVNIIKKF